MNFRSYLPFLEWLPTYSRSHFGHDLIAGLTVGVMLVPQGMAYALLAGVPPIYGLYSGLIPLLLYAFLGTSRQMSIGPVAVSALLVLAGISQVAEPGSRAFLELVILTGLLIGLLQMTMSFLRLGFLVNFLSHPVVVGFSMGAAVIIAISQLKYLLGIDIPRFTNLNETVAYAMTHIQETHIATLFFCFGGILLLILLKKINRAIPGALILLILSVLLVWYFKLQSSGLQIVGEVPEGLPAFQWPDWSMENIRLVIPTVLTVTIIGIVESMSIAKVLEAKHQDYQVEPDQELFALGLSKIAGAFFQAIPTSGSFTRSAINNDAGAKTGISSVITVILIALTLVFLTPLFYYLPNAVLASIILIAVWGLFDYREALYLWKTHRPDFYMLLVTFLVTLIMGIEEGVLAGVLLSLFLVLFRSARPHIAILGQIPDTNYYRNIDRFPQALQTDEMLIIRYDAQLYFGNVSYFKDSIRREVNSRKGQLKVLILDASSIHDMDSSGLAALEEVNNFLWSEKIEFHISGIIGPVRDLLFKSGLTNRIGHENQFLIVHDAVLHYHSSTDDQTNWNKNALQTNIKEKDQK